MSDSAESITIPRSDRAAEITPPLRRSYLQSLADFLFGYDFFISYAWADGRQFAVSLQKQLVQRGYDCFLDSSEYAAGDNWDIVGARAIRKTSNLVLIGTPAALESRPVKLEVERFIRRSWRIIPISIDDTLAPMKPRDGLLGLLAPELLRVVATSAEMVSGPTAETVDRVCQAHTIVRQSTKRQRVILAVAVALAFIAGVATWQWRSAVFQQHEAEKNLTLAAKQRDQGLEAIRQTAYAIESELELVPNLQPLQRKIDEIVLTAMRSMADQRLSNDNLTHFEAISKIGIAKVIAEIGVGAPEGQSALEQSLSILHDAVMGLERIVREHPGNPQYLRDLSWGCNEQGELQMRVGAKPEALALFERSRVAIEEAAKFAPDNIRLKRDQMWSYMKLGDYYQEAGNKAAGGDIRALRELELHWFQQAEQVANGLPTIALQEAESEIGATQDRLFDAYSELGRHDEALACAERVLKLRQSSLDRSPQNKLSRSHLGVALDKMGIAQLNLQKPQDALPWFTKSMELSQHLVREDPNNLEFQYDLARSYWTLAETHRQMGDTQSALAENERFFAIISQQATASPRDAKLCNDLFESRRFKGDLLLKSGKRDLAREQFQQALENLTEFDRLEGKAVFESELRLLRESIKACEPAAAN